MVICFNHFDLRGLKYLANSNFSLKLGEQSEYATNNSLIAIHLNNEGQNVKANFLMYANTVEPLLTKLIRSGSRKFRK